MTFLGYFVASIFITTGAVFWATLAWAIIDKRRRK